MLSKQENNLLLHKDHYLKISKGVIIFISIALIWKLWALPRDGFPFPLSLIHTIGLNKISILLILLMLYNKAKNNESLSVQLPQLNWLFIFLAGMVISFLYNAADIGLKQVYLKGEADGMLTIASFIIGLGFYLIFFYFLSYKNIIDKFFYISIIVAFIWYLAMVMGVDDQLVGLFGNFTKALAKNSYESSVNIARASFPTIDDNVFGPIASMFLVISFYLYSLLKKNQRTNKVFLILFFILSGIVIIKTISRSTVVIMLIQSGIFLLFFLKFKMKTILLLITSIILFWIILLFEIIPGTQYITAISDRFLELFNNIPIYLGEIRKGTEIGYDNAHARILSAQAVLPVDVKGWIFGTGGIYKGYIRGWTSNNHIDIVNWIGHFGLITVIPLLIYLFKMLFYLFKWNISKIYFDIPLNEKRKISNLRILGLSLLPGVLLLWLNSPLFFYFWFVTGITASIIIILRKLEKRRYN